MTRKKIRENLYIMLFRLDFYNKEELKDQVEIYLSDEIEGASEKEKEELRSKFNTVLGNLDVIDAEIESKSKGWTVKRIAKAELTVLRLAVFEILYADDVPDSVAINEAVELSKLYCADKAKGFINGILSSVVKSKESSNPGTENQDTDKSKTESSTEDTGVNIEETANTEQDNEEV